MKEGSIETTGIAGMAMGQEDKFPLWPGSVELAQTLMGHLRLHSRW